MKDIVNLLLKHGANVNAKDNKKWTAMHIACSKGHIEIADLLIQHQAQLDAENENGLMPVHFAFRNKKTDIVQLFLKHEPNVNVYDNKKWTAIKMVCIWLMNSTIKEDINCLFQCNVLLY